MSAHSRVARVIAEVKRQVMRERQSPMRRGITKLQGPFYSDLPPVLARGKRRTLALKLAQAHDWGDERANLYGCHPCPKCGEVADRAMFKKPYGDTIICGACGDHRPVWDGVKSPATH